MAPSDETDTESTEATSELEGEGQEEEAKKRLELDVKVASPSACQRHVTVTIPREDVERYYDNAFKELMPNAAVPGFRAGRAPRKLVEHRFRKDVADQVKGALLMDSMAQVTEEQKLSAISEPDLDVTAVVLPDDGPMTFEFDLEVRPEFDMPNWKGLEVERPVREFDRKDVDLHLKRLLGDHSRLVPHEGPASAGDYLSVNLTTKDGDKVLTERREEQIRLLPVLSFRDGKIEDFDKLMEGVSAGETRQGDIVIADDSASEEGQAKKLTATFEVLEVKKAELPRLTPDLLQEIGGFENEGELRDAVQNHLAQRLSYHQQQKARQQITAALVASADWELPPSLLKRQAKRELDRSVMELRRNGFPDTEIKAHENALRQNSMSSTARALKEHFILERIAEEEGVQDLPEDYEDEIRLIARQSGESPRRVRAQLEKRDLMDILRNQIIERKAIELVLAQAKFKDTPLGADQETTDRVEALDIAVGGEGDEEIPEAKHGGQDKPLTQTPSRG